MQRRVHGDGRGHGTRPRLPRDRRWAAWRHDPDLIAVGGIFEGEDGGGLVGQLQRNEYTRYRRYIGRRRGRVFVLTGTASLFRAYALRAVAEARGTLIPGPTGQGLRHAGDDRGQRADAGAEDPGRPG